MNLKFSFILTFLAGFATLIGTMIVFVFKCKTNKILISSLAFASGVMLSVSFTDLIPNSITLINQKYNKTFSFLLCMLFINLGIIISMIIDKLFQKQEKHNRLYKVGLISMISIIFHNIPEGIATFMATENNINLGISLALAIAIHNIPEGISISVPIYYGTNSKAKAFGYTFISALSEPFGALLCYLFLRFIMTDLILGILFSIIAGIMIHISIYELLPTSIKLKNKKITIISFGLGIIIMLLKLIIL